MTERQLHDLRRRRRSRVIRLTAGGFGAVVGSGLAVGWTIGGRRA